MLKLVKKRITQKEYSKIWMSNWQSFVMFWCSVFFVADIYFNKAEHCVELCICLVTSIAAIFIPYLAKSYFGKKQEENNKIYSELKGLEFNEEVNDEQ